MSEKTINQPNKKSVSSNVFIHIPKCGGSSFVGLLKDSTKPNVHERERPTHLVTQVGNTSIEHIDFSTYDRKFRAPQIFSDDYNEVYKAKNIFMLVRNPFDRLYSEFNFQFHILNGKKEIRMRPLFPDWVAFRQRLRSTLNLQLRKIISVSF